MKRIVCGPTRTSGRRTRLVAIAGLALSTSLSGCTVVGGPTDPPAPRVRVGARPEAPTRSSSSVDLRPVRDFEEVRALWVVRFTMTSPESVVQMVEDAAAAGFNTLIVQVRGRADAFYRSDLEPVGESIREPGTFDPLELTIAEAHRRGMAVHAWVNTHLVWGPAAPPRSEQHLVNAHPEWLAVPRALGKELAAIDPADARFFERLVRYAEENPETVEGVYTSPSHPEVADRVHRVWLDLARRYDLDGIHFDYIRFPNATFDYSVGALERFRLWSRSALREERFAELDALYDRDPYAFVGAEPALWADFRRESVTRLVERIYTDVKAIKPRLVVSAAVIADAELAYEDRFQDWQRWLEWGIVDIAVPMAYTPDSGLFRGLVRTARASAGDRRRVWAGIGAYMNSADGTLEMIDIARAEGTGGVVLFSYDWAVGEGRGDPASPFLRRIGEARFGR